MTTALMFLMRLLCLMGMLDFGLLLLLTVSVAKEPGQKFGLRVACFSVCAAGFIMLTWGL